MNRLHKAPEATKLHRLGFSKFTVSVGALIHAGGLVAGHLVARKLKNHLVKIGVYSASVIGAGFVCKLLHERMTHREKSVLGTVEHAEEIAV